MRPEYLQPIFCLEEEKLRKMVAELNTDAEFEIGSRWITYDKGIVRK